MKRYDELTEDQQAEAVNTFLNELLTDVCEGRVRFNDAANADTLQAKIDAAAEKADEMRTPWFMSEYVMDTCKTELRGMARCRAEDSLYAEPDDPPVIYGIIKQEPVTA